MLKLTIKFAHWLPALTCALTAGAADYPVRPVPFTAVHVDHAFWSPRFETNRTVTVWYDFQKCEETGRIDNFAKAGGLMPGEFKGIPFDDSDVYKVIEGAAYTLAIQPDPKLDKFLDELIAKIAAAQEPDGYLYTARRLLPPEKMPKMSGKERWTNEAASHEQYNVGHLYEAAVAHFQATGKRTLLDVAIKNANLLVSVFGPKSGQLAYPPGHEEIEIGLVKLYRVTSDSRYLDLAKFLIDQRGRGAGHKLYGMHNQDHKPVVEQDEAVGHAVRAGYLYSGVADVAAMTGDADYVAAIDRIWENVATKKLYLTGGIGARRAGEAFGNNYELPNRTAYNETCAAIASALWNHRMFLLHGDGKYLDVLERTIYNGFLAGVSLSGDRFFYPNPLECDGRTRFNHGATTRQAWFGTSCCPVNVVRFVPSIAGYVYATRGDELYVNLFIGGSATAEVAGRKVGLKQETNYPWDGRVKLALDPDSAGEFTLCVRIPGWARNEPVPGDLYRYADAAAPAPELKVNGQSVPLRCEKGFARIRRAWNKADVVELVLPMPVRRVVANPEVKDDAGRIAIERGPIVYCAEAADNDGHVLGLVLSPEAQFAVEHKPDLLGGVSVLRTETAARAKREDDGRVSTVPCPLTLVPYYAWANRAPGEMIVWLATSPARAAEIADTGTVIVKGVKITASFVDPAYHNQLEALYDGIEPKNSIDQSIPRFTWWPHKGGSEWVQYEFKEPRIVSAVQVYWFDDTGKGGCRVPQSWRLLFKSGNDWKPVEGASEYGTKPDTFNRVTFTPVTTSALRLDVQFKAEFSSGILEWKVE